ncbi:MAG: DUF4055 domain-containing protein [Pseudomonadota bacterium]
MPANIATRGSFRQQMDQFWQDSTALMGGVYAMRAAGKTYLPQFAYETNDEYSYRLNSTFLTNLYRKITKSILGHLFRKPIDRTNVNLDPEVLDNIDMNGSTVEDFARGLAKDVLTKGWALLFCEFSQDGAGENILQQQAENRRPYWVRIPPENLVDARVATVAGRARFVEARWVLPEGDGKTELDAGEELIHEVIAEQLGPDGELLAGYWTRYRCRDGVSEIIETGPFEFGPYLPMGIVYATREGHLVGIPTLEGVAQKNLEHWRASSEYSNIVTKTSFPILYEKGVEVDPPTVGEDGEDQEPERVFGPGIMWQHSSADANLTYVSPDPALSTVSERRLDRIVAEAEIEALELRVKASTGQTATAEEIDRVENMSPLQVVSFDIEKCMNEGLSFYAEWLNQATPGRLLLNRDFGLGTSDRVAIEGLKAAVAAGAITTETFVREAKRIGFLSQDIDPEVEALRAREQLADPDGFGEQ